MFYNPLLAFLHFSIYQEPQNMELACVDLQEAPDRTTDERSVKGLEMSLRSGNVDIQRHYGNDGTEGWRSRLSS